MSENDDERPRNPRETSNFIFNFFLLDMIPFYKKGIQQNGIQETDLYKPLEEHKAELLGNSLEHAWIRNKDTYTKWCIHICILQVFGKHLLFTGLLIFIRELGLITIMPYLIDKLISYFSKSSTNNLSIFQASWFGFLFVLCLFVERCMGNPTLLWMSHICMKIRLSCSSLLYRKSLRLTDDTKSGQLVTLLSNDVGKFDVANTVHYVYIAPIQTLVAIYFLYIDVGHAALIGIVFFVFFIPLLMFFAKLNGKLRTKIANTRDKRIKLMMEIIESIRVIKMYVWEQFFKTQILQIRNNELKYLKNYNTIKAIVYSFYVYATRIAIFLTLLFYFLQLESLEASKVFKIVSIFAVLRRQLMFLFPAGINSLTQLQVTLKRIDLFLRSPEIPRKLTNRHITPSITFKEVTLELNHTLIIRNINLELSNQLICLTGPLGSGKTCFFSAILSELPLKSGSILTKGNVSYCPQQPWIFSGTIRDNILFGSKYDADKFKKVIDICALTTDIGVFPNGDLSPVGDKGRMLSGGQKQRINLARCVYRDADIYLLDNPFSSLDWKVSGEIFDKCIKDYLRGKLVIFVSEQMQYFKESDKVILITESGTAALGTYHELIANGTMRINNFSIDMDSVSSTNEDQSENSINEKQDEQKQNKLDQQIIPKKRIHWPIYEQFLKFGGSSLTIALLVASCVLAQLFGNIFDYYTAHWVNKEQDMLASNLTSDEKHSTRMHLMTGFCLVISTTVLIALLNCLWVFLFMNIISRNLHYAVFDKIMDARMVFFDCTATGKILNIFSSDLNTVDDHLPVLYMDLLQIVFALIGTIILTALINWYLLIPYIFVGYVLSNFRIIYLKTSTSVKRIEAAIKGPIYGHAATSMEGLSVLRAFQAERFSTEKFDSHLDRHSSAYFAFKLSAIAFGYWIDLLAVLFIAVSIFIMIVFADKSYGGHLGLVITQYLVLMGNLQAMMRQWTDLENSMVSVDRILEYINLDREGIRKTGVYEKTPPEFPKHGKLAIKNLNLSYDKGKSVILKNVSCSIEAGEKIGIVGRTGAGKSSLIAAIFQLYEFDRGSIKIDDWDVTKLPLGYVRTKITIIPQEVTIFAGSLRSNLDPFGMYNDDEIWKALEAVDMKTDIQQWANGLQEELKYGSPNLSTGQKQLICLARALLRRSKLLILDEPTSNVDSMHEKTVQKVIRDQFEESTVLTIAHKLDTIMDSNKVLVVDQGRIVEFDEPDKLMKNPYGFLYKMVNNKKLN